MQELPEVDGTPIGTGNVADVFLHDGRALKLYKAGRSKSSAFREAANLAMLQGSGLPVPEVFSVNRYDDRWGIVMGLAKGSNPDKTSFLDPAGNKLRHLSALHAEIHARSGSGFPDLRMRLDSSIARASTLPGTLRSGLQKGLRDLPRHDRLCHGDFHPLNVIGEGANSTIIDWLDAACGSPAADLCRSFVLLHGFSAQLARNYVTEYLQCAAFSAEEVFAWLPYVAAARLSEEVEEGRMDLIRWAEGGSFDLE